MNNLEHISTTEDFIQATGHEPMFDIEYIVEGKDVCIECNSPLSNSNIEYRGNGQFEVVTYCNCGATYIS